MLDNELRALVSVEPSPGFEARVRKRIAEAPPRAAWWRWPVVSFAAVAAALMLAAVVRFGGQSPRVDPQLAPLQSQHWDATALPAGIDMQPPGVRLASEPRQFRAVVLEVQINPVEADALQRLLAEPPRTATVVVAGSPVTAEPVDDPGIVIPALSIAPLEGAATTSEGASR